MKCRKCKAEIPDELRFTFCGYCGERLVREKKKKGEVRIPKAVQHGNKWHIDLRKEGILVIEDTEAEAKAKAMAIRAGVIDAVKKPKALTLREAIDNYIADRDNALSPATIRGYRTIQRNAFASVMDEDIYSVGNWQAVVNAEAGRVSAKTLKNEWGLVKAVLRQNKVIFEVSTLPQVIKKDLPWLDFAQIKIFLDAVYGQKCELAALFALHSLRRSEIMMVTPAQIKNNTILVRGSVVYDEHFKLVDKEENKNTSSRRDVPIMIPRLTELIADYEGEPNQPFIQCNPNTLWRQINRVCVNNGLPEAGVHGLRRSFASLAYHLKWSERRTMATGGWSDLKTVHDIYVKLAEADEKADIDRMRDFYNS